jgi:hypothetical protein
MKARMGVDVQIHTFLTSAQVGGEWSCSRPCRVTTRERAAGTHWVESLENPRVGLDEVEKKNS